jgi:hypothetical protein
VRVFSPRWIQLGILCFSLLGFSAAASANDFYVSASGSDSNDGSQARPWKTISHALGSFSLGSGGTTIHVGNGSYASLDITRGGSSGARLVLQCDNGTDSATAASNQCTISSGGAGILVEANNIDIVGFDIGNNANMGTGIDVVANGGSSGNSVHLIGNYIHDLGGNVSPSAGDAGGPGCPESGAILYQSGPTDAQAIRNFVTRYGNVANRGNCNFAQGIYFSGSPGAIAQDNIVVQPVVGGIVFGASCGVTVANNTVLNTVDAIIFGDHDNFRCPGSASGQNTVTNNYLAAYTNAVFNVSSTPDCTSSAPTLFSHNISDGAGTDFKPARSSCDTVSTWSHQAPTAFLVNYQANGTGDYHLKSGSMGIAAGAIACVSGGVSPCTPTSDFEGTARVVPISVGAFEVVQSASGLPSPPSGLAAVVQ